MGAVAYDVAFAPSRRLLPCRGTATIATTPTRTASLDDTPHATVAPTPAAQADTPSPTPSGIATLVLRTRQPVDGFDLDPPGGFSAVEDYPLHGVSMVADAHQVGIRFYHKRGTDQSVLVAVGSDRADGAEGRLEHYQECARLSRSTRTLVAAVLVLSVSLPVPAAASSTTLRFHEWSSAGIVLRQGQSSNAVGFWQNLVKSWETSLSVDGIFGNQAWIHTHGFQTNVAKVPADGIVGPQTWNGTQYAKASAGFDRLQRWPKRIGSITAARRPTRSW